VARRTIALAALTSALGGWTAGCADIHSGQAPATLPSAAIYQRATNDFAKAEFFKPAETKTNDLAFTLAPLILQEVNGGNEPLARLDRFGALSSSNGVLVIASSRPAIYWQADTVPLQGKVHVRLSYVWFYWPEPGGAEVGHGAAGLYPDRTRSSLAPQGVRITLNTAGQPVIWEVLADRSGMELIFISQSLEAAAAAEFGKPLPGRRYAIERSLEEAPEVIVARVIDDGPVAMGPIVYLTAGTHSVSTLLCRCMPAQARKILSTSSYELLPFEAAPPNSFIPGGKARGNGLKAFWPGDDTGGKRLERCLRLPKIF
jgi:hypothetical protein